MEYASGRMRFAHARRLAALEKAAKQAWLCTGWRGRREGGGAGHAPSRGDHSTPRHRGGAPAPLDKEHLGSPGCSARLQGQRHGKVFVQ
jgi:hypothetical protein